MMIDCDFPGGNIIVERIEGTDVYLRQDIRDTEGWWFYWNFRARGVAERPLTFHFTDGDVIGTRGPAVSEDGGATWRWLGRECVATTPDGVCFTVTPGHDVALAPELRFAFAIPYQQAHLEAFLARHAGNRPCRHGRPCRYGPHLRADVLCITAKGRAVEAVRLGCLEGEPQHRVLLTSRHHACESLATYSLEGLLEEVLAESDAGRWLRAHVAFLVVPFMDKDGVEDGDQGKNRRPHDHNRDYGRRGGGDADADESLYASTRALRQLIPAWAAGKLRLALDLHCPWIRGEHNEVIYFVGGPDQENWARVMDFSRLLEAVRTGPLVYRAADNLPFGVGWNTSKNTVQGRSFGGWATALPGIWIGASLEIPYANARDATVTAEAARAFGRDLGRAIANFCVSQ